MSERPPPAIMGPDGKPIPGTGPKPQQVTPEQFCSQVIGAYLNQLVSSGVDPFHALMEMGVQVPQIMIQLVKGQTQLVGPAKEPLEFYLQQVSNVLREYGFRFLFKFEHTGEVPEGSDETTEREGDADGRTSESADFGDSPGEIQGDGNQENQGSTEEPGPAESDGQPEIPV